MLMRLFLVAAGLLIVVSATTCPTDGSGYSYSETVTGQTRAITYQACPNHAWKAVNPNQAQYSTMQTINVPAYPTLVGSGVSYAQTADLKAQGGNVGVLFNGAAIFSPFGGPRYGTVTGYANAAVNGEGSTFDSCNCHSSQGSDSYHCHAPPVCLLKQLNETKATHSKQVGWASDGFPMYGPYGAGGVAMKTCSSTQTFGTDVCTNADGGHYGALSGTDSYTFRYYIKGPTCATSLNTLQPITSAFTFAAEYHPHTPTGYYGCCPTGVACSLRTLPACTTGGTVNGYVTGMTPTPMYTGADALTTMCDSSFATGQGGAGETTGSGCSAASVGFTLNTCDTSTTAAASPPPPPPPASTTTAAPPPPTASATRSVVHGAVVALLIVIACFAVV